MTVSCRLRERYTGGALSYSRVLWTVTGRKSALPRRELESSAMCVYLSKALGTNLWHFSSLFLFFLF